MNKRGILRFWPAKPLLVVITSRPATDGRRGHRGSRLVLSGLATLLASGLLAVIPAQVASAATLNVTNCGDGGGGSLRGELAVANSGDTIDLSSCPAATPIHFGSPIDITRDITIAGTGPTQVVLDGVNLVQLFHIEPGVTATISGVTIENGLSTGGCNADCASSGGGIENEGSLTVTNDVITDNSVVSGCVSNCGAFGGGIENDITGTLHVNDSTFTGNSSSGTCGSACSGNGGAIINLGNLIVTDSTFASNSSGSGCTSNCAASGAGIENGSALNNSARASITGSTFTLNSASFGCSEACGSSGGGIDNFGVLDVHNSTLADNNAGVGCVSNCAAFGGGLANETGGSIILKYSTLSANTAGAGCNVGCGAFGGDLYNDGDTEIGATIVANSAAAGGDCSLAVPLTDVGYNLDDDGTCGFTAVDQDLSDTPAGLDPAGLQDNGGPTQTIELGATSAAVDHVVNPNLCPPTDQRGNPRVVPCDIGAYDTDGPVADGSQVHAVIQVETSPSYANDPVHIDSSQLQAACGGTITFETLQSATARVPRTSTDSITVILDDDGNTTVVVDASDCAPGSDVIEADLTVAPFLTALTTIDVEAPQVTPVGVSAYPANEVETGNTPNSGDSNVYTVFYVETSPVYAEQPVEISSPQLESRCTEGWRIEPGVGDPINQGSGTSTAKSILDDDGNAEFVFKGVSCGAGPSAVIADVMAGTHPTYVTTYTVGAPAVTLTASLKAAAADTNKKGKAKGHQQPKVKHPKHPKKHHGAGSGSGSGSGTGAAPAPMIVDASPNPLIETGVPQSAPQVATLNVTKTDDNEGSSITGQEGSLGCEQAITYTITITNSGTVDLNGVQVTDNLLSIPDIDSDTYTAVGTGTASGFTASGSGNINDTVDLPPGTSITYTVPAVISDNPPDFTAVNTVTLTPPGGVVLSSSSNTSATDKDVNDCS
jgi:uncharacterized repeat protein (TIGR01451 family)